MSNMLFLLDQDFPNEFSQERGMIESSGFINPNVLISIAFSLIWEWFVLTWGSRFIKKS